MSEYREIILVVGKEVKWQVISYGTSWVDVWVVMRAVVKAAWLAVEMAHAMVDCSVVE